MVLMFRVGRILTVSGHFIGDFYSGVHTRLWRLEDMEEDDFGLRRLSNEMKSMKLLYISLRTKREGRKSRSASKMRRSYPSLVWPERRTHNP
mmetsp:Transcript_10719/g.25930  ORF Transcript_10719/g.25930 Transcript_10719/m.25930 type:complete len:92 (-) Transcript_10719:1182-1457(-)